MFCEEKHCPQISQIYADPILYYLRNNNSRDASTLKHTGGLNLRND